MAGRVPRPPPDHLLRIEVSPTEHVIDVRLIGEMDLSTRGQLLAALEAKPLNGAAVVNLDMTQLDFCDASGITDLLDARDAMALQQRTCSATAARPHLRRLFTLAGLDEMLAPEAESPAQAQSQAQSMGRSMAQSMAQSQADAETA